MRRFLPPFLITITFGLAWTTFGAVSTGLFFVAVVACLAWPIFVLVKAVRSGTASGSLLGATASALCLVVLVTVFIAVPGDFHRDHSHRDDNLADHPDFGWLPTLREGDAQKGLTVEATVGQRLEIVDPSREHIVLMGDSVMYGWGVGDEETAGAFLAQKMDAAQVVNASVSGYAIDQYYLYLKDKLPLLRPKVVVVGVYAGNDYEATGRDNWYGHRKPLFVPDGESIRLKDPSKPDLNCVDLLAQSLLFHFLWKDLEVGQAVLNLVCNTTSLSDEDRAVVVRRLLDKTAELVSAHDARLLWVLLPDRNDWRKNSWYTNEKTRYPHLARILKETGHEVLWLYDVFDAYEDKDALYLPDDSAHYSVLGNQVLADALAKRL